MKKSKKSLVVTLLVIFILLISTGGFCIYKLIKHHNTYSNIVKSNWNIELPSNYIEIYSKDSGDSFLGDGERYHVFEYKDNSNIDQSLEWQSDRNIDVESSVIKILSSLDISSKYLPTFEDDYRGKRLGEQT